MVDFFFFYKHLLRSLLIYKSFGLYNTYSVPYVNKFLCFFSMRSIDDVDQVQGYIMLIYINFFLVDAYF
jgi:hypothetical protein